MAASPRNGIALIGKGGAEIRPDARWHGVVLNRLASELDCNDWPWKSEAMRGYGKAKPNYEQRRNSAEENCMGMEMIGGAEEWRRMQCGEL